MITTSEAIGNPLEFICANPSLTRYLHEGQAVSITSPDYDVSITGRSVTDARSTPTGTNYVAPTNKLFGDLLIQGHSSKVFTGNNCVKVSWYASPPVVNGISESLGLRLGRDVLAVTHTEGANIPARQYMAHLAKGQFPISTDGGPYFHHDRDGTHLPGVLAMPPRVTDKIIKLAKGGGTPYLRCKDYEGGLALAVDELTDCLSRVAMWASGAVTNAVVTEPLPGYQIDALRDPTFWSLPERSRNKQSPTHLVEAMLINHFKNIKPKIERLKAAQAR